MYFPYAHKYPLDLGDGVLPEIIKCFSTIRKVGQMLIQKIVFDKRLHFGESISWMLPNDQIMLNTPINAQ